MGAIKTMKEVESALPKRKAFYVRGLDKDGNPILTLADELGGGSGGTGYMEYITEYNVSVQHPTSGIDGSNKYSLEGAITQVPQELRNIGLKVSFINSDGKVETWEFQGGAFTEVGGWVKNPTESNIQDLQKQINHISGATIQDGDYPKNPIVRHDNSQIGYISQYTGIIKHLKFRVKQLRGDANDGIHINNSIVIPAEQMAIDQDTELDVNIPINKGDVIWAYYLCGCNNQPSPNCVLRSNMTYFKDRAYAMSWIVETQSVYVGKEELGNLNELPEQPSTVVEALKNADAKTEKETEERGKEVGKINEALNSFDGVAYNEGHYPDTFNETQSQRAGYKVKHSGYLKHVKFRVSTPKHLYVNDTIIIDSSNIVPGDNEFSFGEEIFVNEGDCINIGSIIFDRTAVESYIWDFKQDSTRRYAIRITIQSKPKYTTTEKFENFVDITNEKVSTVENKLEDISRQIKPSIGYTRSTIGELPQYLKLYKVSLFKEFTDFTGDNAFAIDNPQGFDIYESRYLFQGSYKAGTGGSVIVVDLDTGVKLGKIQNIGVEHVNLVICGDKYEEGDAYPLLWVSSVANQPSDGVLIRLKNDLSGFDVIHNIKYNGNQLTAGAHIIPYKEAGKIILYSFGEGAGSNVGKALFVDDSILSGKVDVTISDSDIERNITFQAAPKMQGARVLGGQLCVPTGIGTTAAILFVNLTDGAIETKIPLAGELYPFNESEPEAVALYKNCLITMGKDKAEYRIIKFAIGSTLE